MNTTRTLLLSLAFVCTVFCSGSALAMSRKPPKTFSEFVAMDAAGEGALASINAVRWVHLREFDADPCHCRVLHLHYEESLDIDASPSELAMTSHTDRSGVQQNASFVASHYGKGMTTGPLVLAAQRLLPSGAIQIVYGVNPEREPFSNPASIGDQNKMPVVAIHQGYFNCTPDFDGLRPLNRLPGDQKDFSLAFEFVVFEFNPSQPETLKLWGYHTADEPPLERVYSAVERPSSR